MYKYIVNFTIFQCSASFRQKSVYNQTEQRITHRRFKWTEEDNLKNALTFNKHLCPQHHILEKYMTIRQRTQGSPSIGNLAKWLQCFQHYILQDPHNPSYCTYTTVNSHILLLRYM